MSVSVDCFITDLDGDFGWTLRSDEQFRFSLAHVGELGAYLLGRRLYETMHDDDVHQAVVDGRPASRPCAICRTTIARP